MITTIKIKDIIKYLVMLIIVIFTILAITRYFLRKKNENKIDNYSIIKNNDVFLSCINISIPITKTLNNDEIKNNNIDHIRKNKENTSRSGLLRMLDIELPNVENIEDKAKSYNNEIDANLYEETENVADRINIKDTYTNQYNTVKVKNLTNIKLTQEILKPDYSIKNKKNIIIYHTHTCESYTQTEKNKYNASGNFRTTDLKYSVVSVGDELESELKKRKFKVTHNNTKHDYPAYTGSYSRSLETINSILKNESDTEIIFDIHRDAVGNKGTYAPTVEINGEKVAQLMFVIGTNDGGGNHPNWKNNLKFAVKVQEKANEMYPGLFRSINLRSATFNQKVSNAASIIEVGATGNTLEEAKASMKYLANILDNVLK